MANEKQFRDPTKMIRLIDANLLIGICEEIAKHEWNKRASPVSWSDAYEGFIDTIEEMPTVDAVEVVHGRWIEKYENVSWCEDDIERFFECSICKCLSGYSSPYCPNCGADMR